MYINTGVIHVWYIRCDSCMVHDCIDRDAAAAGQPPGQPSHPAAPGPGLLMFMGPRGRRSLMRWKHVGLARRVAKTWQPGGWMDQ